MSPPQSLTNTASASKILERQKNSSQSEAAFSEKTRRKQKGKKVGAVLGVALLLIAIFVSAGIMLRKGAKEVDAGEGKPLADKSPKDEKKESPKDEKKESPKDEKKESPKDRKKDPKKTGKVKFSDVFPNVTFVLLDKPEGGPKKQLYPSGIDYDTEVSFTTTLGTFGAEKLGEEFQKNGFLENQKYPDVFVNTLQYDVNTHPNDITFFHSFVAKDKDTRACQGIIHSVLPSEWSDEASAAKDESAVGEGMAEIFKKYPEIAGLPLSYIQLPNLEVPWGAKVTESYSHMLEGFLRNPIGRPVTVIIPYREGNRHVDDLEAVVQKQREGESKKEKAAL